MPCLLLSRSHGGAVVHEIARVSVEERTIRPGVVLRAWRRGDQEQRHSQRFVVLPGPARIRFTTTPSIAVGYRRRSAPRRGSCIVFTWHQQRQRIRRVPMSRPAYTPRTRVIVAPLTIPATDVTRGAILTSAYTERDAHGHIPYFRRYRRRSGTRHGYQSVRPEYLSIPFVSSQKAALRLLVSSRRGPSGLLSTRRSTLSSWPPQGARISHSA